VVYQIIYNKKKTIHHNDTAHYSTFAMNQQNNIDIVDEKWQRTTVYGIICMITGEIYVGTTIQTLDDRIAQHIKERCCMAIQILDRGNYKAYVIQMMPCNTKREVLTLEGGWQRAYKASFPDHFVNRQIEGQFICDTPETRKAYDKEYSKKHKETRNARSLQWYQENKEEHYAKGKVRRTKPWSCEWCGNTMTDGSKYGHRRRCKSKPNQKIPAPLPS